MNFVGIDLEWASDVPGNLCEIGVVWVEGGEEAASFRSLIRPIHEEWGTWQFLNLPYGLEEAMEGPTFPEVWQRLWPKLSNLPWVAHNAAVAEARMLGAALAHHGLEALGNASIWCTLDLAKDAWPEIPAHGLHRMSAHLGLPLEHHNPESDARTCAQLVIEAARHRGKPTFEALAEDMDWHPHELHLIAPELPAEPSPTAVFGVALTPWESPALFTGASAGARFVMSGLSEAQKHVVRERGRQLGLKASTTLNGRTAFVVAGPVMGPAKYRKCKQHSIPILGIKEWEAWAENQ